MSESWTKHLRQLGGVVDNGVVSDFGNPQLERRVARDGNVLVDLSSLSLLRARGPDAKTFLNAQFSNDLDLIDAGTSHLSSWCNAQGRMLAVLRLFMRAGDYYLQLPAALRDEIAKRLRMFVLRAKVTIDCVDSELIRFGVIGPDCVRLLSEAGIEVPSQANGCATHSALTILHVPGVSPRFEVVAPPAEAIALWDKLRAQAAPVGCGTWFWHDIMAGLPTVLPETREEFVPQMANLELVGGVNFKKGCYPGQEIVARMHYLGRLKQRMYRAHVDAEPVAPGTPIFAPGTGGQSAGKVVQAQAAPESGTDLLAVIQIAAVEAGALFLGSAEGPRLTIEALPYPLATSSSQKKV